jgi:predicted hydrolase (HD superfamily)
MQFIEELGVPFEEHVARVLAAMQGIAPALGVAGPDAPSPA